MKTDATSALAALRAAFDAFAACDFESLSHPELVALMDDYETLTCQLPSPSQRMLTQLQTQTTPKELGAKSWNEVLRVRWRLSTGEAGRRLAEADELAPRCALTGSCAETNHEGPLETPRRRHQRNRHPRTMTIYAGRAPAAAHALSIWLPISTSPATSTKAAATMDAGARSSTTSPIAGRGPC